VAGHGDGASQQPFRFPGRPPAGRSAGAAARAVMSRAASPSDLVAAGPGGRHRRRAGTAGDQRDSPGRLRPRRLRHGCLPRGANPDQANAGGTWLASYGRSPARIAPDAVKRILGGLMNIAAGLGELRNRGYGTGHRPRASESAFGPGTLGWPSTPLCHGAASCSTRRPMLRRPGGRVASSHPSRRGSRARPGPAVEAFGAGMSRPWSAVFPGQAVVRDRRKGGLAQVRRPGRVSLRSGAGRPCAGRRAVGGALPPGAPNVPHPAARWRPPRRARPAAGCSG